MDQILDWFHAAVKALSHGDALASAGVTMWLLTVTGVLLRRVPRLLFMRIRSKFVVRMVMNKPATDNGVSTVEMRNFTAFLTWFDTLPSAKYDRNRKPHFKGNGDVVFLPGYGFHWFIFKGRYYWFRLKEVDSQGINQQKEQLSLYTFGVSLAPLERIVDQFKIVPDKDTLQIFTPTLSGRGASWGLSASIPLKGRPSPIVNDSIQRDVFDRVEEFLANEQWYRDRGLPYKTTFMLMGPPGTGKTSIARDIAIRYKLRFHDLNLTEMGDRSLKEAISGMKPGGMLLIDDFDDLPTLHHRKTNVVAEPGEMGRRQAVSLSAFLAALDGAIPLDNTIVILITNHPQLLDPAIYRPGRVDHKIVVGPLDEDKVCEYIHRMYDRDYTGRVEPTVVAALSGIFNRNKHDFDNFCREYVDYLDGKLKLDQLEFSGETVTTQQSALIEMIKSANAH